MFVLFFTFQRWQKSCVRRHLRVIVGRCTLSVTTCPCCLPSLVRATSTRKTRRTSRVGSTGDPTRPHTATQVRLEAAAAPPTFPSMIPQVRRRTSTARARCSADEPAASKEGPSYSFKTNRQPLCSVIRLCIGFCISEAHFLFCLGFL